MGVPSSKVQTKMRKLWKFVADMIYLEPLGFYYLCTEYFFFLQTSAFLLCWSGFDTAPCVMLVLLYLQIALVEPSLFAVLSQSAFFTRCYNISLQHTAPWGWAFDTNTCSRKKRESLLLSRFCFLITHPCPCLDALI